jgi:hypothetical protein
MYKVYEGLRQSVNLKYNSECYTKMAVHLYFYVHSTLSLRVLVGLVSLLMYADADFGL